MKNMKIKILFMVLLLSPLCAAWGQSMVNDVPPIPSDTSIVRYWQQGVCIVYTHNKDNENWFLLVDSAMPQVRRIAVPENVTVNDFRIFNDTVFIGGHVVLGMGNLYGLLACFAIQDFYNGMGSYHWIVTLPTPMPDCLCGEEPYLSNCENQIYDVTRLYVYDSGGYSKIAYIAKNFVNSILDSRVGVGCARYDGSQWRSMLLYNKYAIEEYTDIIATENYVVAVARTNDSARLALRIYPKTNFLYPNGTYPNDFFYPNKYGQGLADLEVDDNVMATPLYDDKFALAYHYKKLSDDGLAVRTFDIMGGLAVLSQGLNAPVVRQPGSIWKMRDIRYSHLHQHLIVLNDIDRGSGVQSSIVYQFQLPTLVTGPYYGRCLKDYTLYAMDTFGNMADFFVASGRDERDVLLSLYWEYLIPYASCGIQVVINGYTNSPSLYSTFMQTNLNRPIPYDGSTSFFVENVEKDVICGQ